MLRAAATLKAQNAASPILIGEGRQIRQLASEHDIDFDPVSILDPAQHAYFDELVEAVVNGPRKLSEPIAQRLIRKPLMYGAALVRAGKAHAMIAGASVPTSKVLEAGLMIIGAQEGIETPSSYFLMRLPAGTATKARSIIFADCAVNVNPSAEQLADIAIATAASAHRVLDEEPRVAMLSFSSKGSARHELVDKVAQAAALATQKRPDLKIDGEFQFDTAFDPRVAKLKLGTENRVAGQANVFIFPDLNSGNVGYKIAQYLAKAEAIGPMLQGFARPIADLSRGATADDIIKTARLLATAQFKNESVLQKPEPVQ